MGAPRKFDHDECSRRYKAGWTIRELADAYGVSWNGVQRVVDLRTRLRTTARSTAMHQHFCVDCGGPCTWNRYARPEGADDHRCRECWAAHRTTTVREHELLCLVCREWKPDDEFPGNRSATRRRGCHTSCRVCQTVLRQEYRLRHRIPCSHGCGTLVHSERRNQDKPPECRECYHKRMRAGKVAA